ncbi:amino acid ABC transporter substrate-binding protein, partial [Pantoea sp. SIMBA_133]
MRHKNKTLLTLSLAALSTAALGVTSSASAATLDEVTSRGELQCGVNVGLSGFSSPDENGNWQGLDVETCRAISAA